MGDLVRYSVIPEKNPREIVLLRGSGCKWKKCIYCDYHLDACPDENANFALNRSVLAKVTGLYGHLEVINSGSFPELDEETMEEIIRVCREKNITLVHFEAHWMYRKKVPALRARFAEAGIDLKLKIGVETFDPVMREDVLCKGMPGAYPDDIAGAGFDECCLLFGLSGQTEESMARDLHIGLTHFQRVCVNMMCENTTPVKPDPDVSAIFLKKLAPLYWDDPRVDILTNNVEFGVGAREED